MATITGLTAARMLAIEAASVVDGDIVGDNLILTKHDGSTINAGSVRGAQGVAGPAGSDLAVLTARSILDVGLLNQIRAGRQLSATDFTNLGLSAPVGLYNLGDTADSSGNGRTLINRGAVTFDIGINGLATTAARFTGSATQGFYILDTGAADPFRIRSGSVGCWMRTAKRSVSHYVITKADVAGTNVSYYLYVNAAEGTIEFGISADGTWNAPNFAYIDSLTMVADDRWHFVVGTADGTMVRLYVDGVYEGYAPTTGRIFAGTAPFNIGILGLVASGSGVEPNFGLIDEAFITTEVLTEDQIRNLYCAKIAHTFGSIPKRSSINVRRLRKGAALLTSDFPTAPLRLYNFSAGSLNNEGSDANGAAGTTATFANNGAALAAGTTSVDGLSGNAFSFNGANQSLSATDTGLPSGTNPWSFGQWVKTTKTANNMVVSYYGYNAAAYSVAHLFQPTGVIVSRNVVGGNDIAGPYIGDGEWHFIVTTAHNAPTDGVKRKLYVDGKLVGGSTVLNSVVLSGSNAHRVGAGNLGTDLPFFGQVDSSFICNYALTADQIVALYIKGTQSLGVSPKNEGDHIEQMNAANLLCIFDTLEMQHQIDLAVG